MPNMKYRVMMDDGNGHDMDTAFTHSAPGWLFDKETNNTPRYLDVLKDEYHEKILRSTPWRCLACPKKATELLSRPFVFLSEGLIADRLVPICQPNGDCEHIGIVHLNNMCEHINQTSRDVSGKTLHSTMLQRRS